jgi:fatty-acyl-CoA synthase
VTQAYFEAIERQALVNADAVFLDLYAAPGTSQSVSYSRFVQGLKSAAALLAAEGVRRGDTVLIFAQHSTGMLYAFFGAQYLGAIPSFMPPPTAKIDLEAWRDSHRKLIERNTPACVVSEPSCFDQVASLGEFHLLNTDTLEQAPPAPSIAGTVADLDDPAFLQHSSGTTGLKKGVIVTYRQLLSQVETYARSIDFVGGRDVVVSWLPLYHDMGLIAATLMPFTLGSRIRLIATFAWLSNPTRIIDLLSDTPNAFAWLPNFAFAYLAQRGVLPKDPAALSGVRAVINCSEPCKAPAMDAFYDKFRNAGLGRGAVRVCYAMAEYVFAVTQTAAGAPGSILLDRDALEAHRTVTPALPGQENTQSIVSVGRAIDGVQLRIDAAPGEEVGEVCVSGPSLCNGYYRNPELTERKFRDGWYLTGDLGFIHDGELYITGRADDLIIVRGRNIYAHDVEGMMSAVEGVKEGRVVAFGVDNAKTGTQDLIVLAETAVEGAFEPIETEMREANLATFGVSPAEIRLVPLNSLVKTSSGKISRAENKARYLVNAA